MRALLDAQIPVMGHLGLTPQSVMAFGGFKVQAKTMESAEVAHRRTRTCSKTRASSPIVIEGVPSVVGTTVTEALDIPTIGIGAGPDTDGQVLVFHDLLGLTNRPPAKFVRQYAESGTGHHRGDSPLRRRRAKRRLSQRRRGLPQPRGLARLANSGVARVGLSFPQAWEVTHTLLCFPQSPAEPDQRERKMAMRPYETMIVFDTAVDAQTIQIALDRALETIRTNGGTPGAIDRWGKRPLAYEINKRKEGYYVLVEFSGEPSTVVELDRILTLSDEVLRFKILRRHERPTPSRVTAQA